MVSPISGYLEVDDVIPPWTATPEDWPPVASDILEKAVAPSLTALGLSGPAPAHERLARYYDRHGEYAGATFLNLATTEWQDITSSDLLATSLLKVDFHAADVRRLLESGPHRRIVRKALRTLPETDLATAGPKVLSVMSEFYNAVKVAVSTRTAQSSDR